MMTDTLIKISRSFNFGEYKDLMNNLAENSGTTGQATIQHIAATKINAQRFVRIDKHCELIPELIEVAGNFSLNCLWIVIAESWCGDGAQCIPVIAKIAKHTCAVEMKIILRDENPEIMEAYLTNGSRSIPKLICIDKNTQREIGIWGSRPREIQKQASDFRKDNPNASHEEFVTNLHLCYGRDKTKSIQNEFVKLLDEWNRV